MTSFEHWLRASAHRLRTVDPDEQDDDDLEPLLDIIGDARVVAIGESMHRMHEFLQVRHRVFRFLARRAGFTALVMESGMPEGALVDRWIRTGEGRLRDVLAEGIGYRFGACQEMLDQVTWMREQHVRGSVPVRFAGMDIPDSSASVIPAVHAALALLDDADPHYAAHLRSTLLPLFSYLPADRTGLAQAAPAIQSYLALDAAVQQKITVALTDLVARMRARRPDMIASLGGANAAEERVRFGIRAAESAQAGDAFLHAMVSAPSRTWPAANVRDVWMADSVEWVLEREPRVLVAAANGHVQRTPFSAPPFVPEPMTTLGGHLADRLGDDYVAIGTAFGHGDAWLHRPRPDDAPGHSHPFVQSLGAPDPASADAAFSGAGIGDLLVDLRTTPPEAASALDRTVGLRNGDVLQPLPIREAFDAIAYIDEVTPWHTWIDENGLA